MQQCIKASAGRFSSSQTWSCVLLLVLKRPELPLHSTTVVAAKSRHQCIEAHQCRLHKDLSRPAIYRDRSSAPEITVQFPKNLIHRKWRWLVLFTMYYMRNLCMHKRGTIYSTSVAFFLYSRNSFSILQPMCSLYNLYRGNYVHSWCTAATYKGHISQCKQNSKMFSCIKWQPNKQILCSSTFIPEYLFILGRFYGVQNDL